ncbi:MAG TPA: nuclear transport factor 2 family protein [Gemmatimonadales bacterium]|nr:nuclear transport factor 2 family protein [Gemmatimonadales bacterium]
MTMDVRELLSRDVTPELYREIRELWKAHSIAEDRRDIAGLIATLTPDCVYEVFPDGGRWEGHAGATRFYLELLGAFPDIHFDLQTIVIGPQGVCEEARVTGTHKVKWLDREPTGQKVEFRVVIFFPWDPDKRKFAGERVFAFS